MTEWMEIRHGTERNGISMGMMPRDELSLDMQAISQGTKGTQGSKSVAIAQVFKPI
jgi:hypothetical protein